MRAIEIGLQQLAQCGITYAFGIPAGSINAIYDALLDIPEINSVIVKHEASAGYMAAAYSRITGRPSLALGSSGPGATNLLTSCANAFTEKTPVIFITGSVPTHIIGKGGAQELPAVPLFKSITKMACAVHNPSEIPSMLVCAFETAVAGVPGPVHIELPINVQMADIACNPVIKNVRSNFRAQCKSSELDEVIRILRQPGQTGAILLGYGAKAAKSLVLELAERVGWMVATTPRGKGAFPETHPLSLGVYGLAGHTKAIEYLNSSTYDVLVVIGSSLGESGTCNWDERLVKGKKLIQIDYDEEVFGRHFAPFHSITGHVESVLGNIIEKFEGIASRENDPVLEVAVALDESALTSIDSDSAIVHTSDLLKTRDTIRRIGECASEGTKFYVDIGEMMTYSIQELIMKPGFDFDINIHFGGMGSGITSAIGAKLAEPKRPVVCISGDGCFFMHGMEILTAKEYKIPVVFIVVNNARLGMVYHGHRMQYGRSPKGFSQERINLAEVARSFGVKAYEMTRLSDITKEMFLEWEERGESIFVEVIVEGNEIPPMGERVKFLQGATY